MKQLKNITISKCGTFHLDNGVPLYSNRFLSVLKFANIGLAAVRDDTGSYHIKIDGKPAYNERFDKSYGFYCGLAAVAHNGKYFHITPEGNSAYNSNFSWVGNFQEDICVVKDGGKFHHIDVYGNSIYLEKYDYVGDFKDGIAVVYKASLATHINNEGQYIHNKWFKQLDVYHKRYARAEDDKGWFHIDKQGNELYQSRYKNIETFYNDLARVETFEGAVFQINPANEVTTTILNPNVSIPINELSDSMVGFWKTFIIYTGVKLGIFDGLPASLKNLAKTIGVPQHNLTRVLRALWELSLITYDTSVNQWTLTELGKLLKTGKGTFLNNAAILWANVAAQHWLQLPNLLKGEITQHASFKDSELDEQNIFAYLSALEGYAIKDVSNFFNNYPILDKRIIGFGRTSLGLIRHFANMPIKLNASAFVGSKIPKLHYKHNNIQIIENIEQASPVYDVGLLLRFLHYFDDQTALKYLVTMSKLKIKKLLIFETIVSNNSPVGGLLDINMIIETGGKLRTLEEWQQMFKQSNYLLTQIIEINPYLTLLEAELK